MEEKAKNPVFKAALIYGGIFGVAIILLSVILEVLGLTYKMWASYMSIPIVILLLVYALTAYKKEYLGGYAKFEQLMLMTLLMALFAAVISTIYSFVFMTWIDPDMLDKLKNVQYDMLMKNPRMTEEAIDTSLEIFEKMKSKPLMLLFGFLGTYFRVIIWGLIIAAFVKKKNPAEIIA